MYIARILYPVKVLGPGNRVGIWFDGCDHHCIGCSNPELWEIDEKYKTDIKQVMRLIGSIKAQYEIDGFTLTGGDPMKQPSALRVLLPELVKITDDILIYTGFDYEDLKHNYADILKQIAVLIDGKYVEELNEEELLKGSSNQRIIILKEAYGDKYHDYMATHVSEIQNFTTPTGTISVGIHRPGYELELERKLKEKGLRKNE